ncbi:Uncharacterised protein [Mycobacterium tuberculosis]|nr:Uncharacterised protein [Mycobacterium tuberculosis]
MPPRRRPRPTHPSSVRRPRPAALRRFAPWWRPTRPERRTLPAALCRFRSRSAAPLSPRSPRIPILRRSPAPAWRWWPRTLVRWRAIACPSPPTATLARRRPRPVLDHRVPPPRHRGRHRRPPRANPRRAPAGWRQPPRCAPAGARGHAPACRPDPRPPRSPGVLPPRWLVGGPSGAVRRWTWTTA